jgi:hypothetical protein
MIARIEKWIVNPYTDIAAVNYKIGLSVRLEPKYTFNNGELVLTEYFYDGDLILDVACTYTRESNGILGTRQTIRTWYNEDGTAYPEVKTTSKTYTEIAAQRERKTRNQNVLDLAMARAMLFGMSDMLTIIFNDCTLEITRFIHDNSDELYNKINDSTLYTDLDVVIDPTNMPGVTARDWIKSKFAYVLTEQ